eukprot:Em0002g1798a
MTVASRSYLTDTSRHYRVSELVEAVQHCLFGIAIDEGFKGPQANTLAWDVLYPEAYATKWMFRFGQNADKGMSYDKEYYNTSQERNNFSVDMEEESSDMDKV